MTREFIASMEAVAAGGRDPMLCSGEIPHAFTVGEPEVSGTAARVTVGGNLAAWRIDLRQQGSVWRITAITWGVG